MISLLLSSLLNFPGAVCPGGAASLGAFVGVEKEPARVIRIEKIVPADPSFQGYAIAFELTGSDRNHYLTFPSYRKLAPDMVDILSSILGRPFKQIDAQSVFIVQRSIREHLHSPKVRLEPCAALSTAHSGR